MTPKLSELSKPSALPKLSELSEFSKRSGPSKLSELSKLSKLTEDLAGAVQFSAAQLNSVQLKCLQSGLAFQSGLACQANVYASKVASLVWNGK